MDQEGSAPAWEVRRGGSHLEREAALVEAMDHLAGLAGLADPARHDQARAALAAMGPERRPALREGISHPSWRVRSWSCRLLQEESLDGLTGARLVAAVRGDPHKSVRRQALRALVVEVCAPARPGPDGTGATSYDVVGLLLDRLRNDRSASVRRAAARGLELLTRCNATREPRVSRGLRRALGSEDDPAMCYRLGEALTAFNAGEDDDPYHSLRWAMGQRHAVLALRLVQGHMRRWESQGCFAEARHWLEQVLAHSDGAPPNLVAGTLHDAGYAALASGDVASAAAHLRASVAQWGLAGDHVARLRTKGLMRFVAGVGGDTGAIDDLEADLAEVRRLGDEAMRCDALVGYGQVRMFRGTPQLARAHLEEGLALARRVGLEAKLAGAQVTMGSLELAQGNHGAARAHLDEGVARSSDEGDTHTELIGRCWLAEIECRHGVLPRARRQLEPCIEEARTMGAPYPLALALLGLGRVEHGAGRFDDARDRFEAAASAASAAGLVHLVAEASIGCGEVAEAQGRHRDARRLFEQVRTQAIQAGDDLAVAHSSFLLGRLARARGHLGRADTLHHEALTRRQHCGDRAGMADTFEALASLALALALHNKAARLFGAAEAMRAAVGCVRPPHLRAAYDGDVAILRGKGDPTLVSAWAAGADLTLSQALWFVRRGRGRRDRPAKGWDALTPAERRVAYQVGAGLTNVEVAARLFIGAETVKSHVANVLAKLDAHSRAELRRSPDVQGSLEENPPTGGCSLPDS